jgi:hypothetical protein
VTLGLWLFYLAGQALNILKHAQMSSSSSLSGVRSIEEWIWANRIGLAVRVFLATALLLWWSGNPTFLNSVLSHFGITIGFELPLTKATAGVYGFFSDAILDFVLAKIPGFQKEVPPLNAAVAAAKQNAADVAAVKGAGQ